MTNFKNGVAGQPPQNVGDLNFVHLQGRLPLAGALNLRVGLNARWSGKMPAWMRSTPA